MDTITFIFLISLVAKENLDMRLMDVITAYLYGSLDNDIKCLEYIILHPEVCILSSYKDPYMGLSNPDACGIIALVNIF